MSNTDNLTQRLRRAVDHALMFSDDVVNDRAVPFDDLAMRDRALSAFDTELRLSAPAPAPPEGEQEKRPPERIWINDPVEETEHDQRWWYEHSMAFPTVEYIRADVIATTPPDTPVVARVAALAEEINALVIAEMNRQFYGPNFNKLCAIITRHFAATEQDELADECQRRMDQVVEAAVEWDEAGREGGEWFEAAEKLSAAINSLLELRDKLAATTAPSSETAVGREAE